MTTPRVEYHCGCEASGDLVGTSCPIHACPTMDMGPSHAKDDPTLRRELEDGVRVICDGLSPLEKALLYRYLYTLGLRIQEVEQTIRREFGD